MANVNMGWYGAVRVPYVPETDLDALRAEYAQTIAELEAEVEHLKRLDAATNADREAAIADALAAEAGLTEMRVLAEKLAAALNDISEDWTRCLLCLDEQPHHTEGCLLIDPNVQALLEENDDDRC